MTEKSPDTIPAWRAVSNEAQRIRQAGIETRAIVVNHHRDQDDVSSLGWRGANHVFSSEEERAALSAHAAAGPIIVIGPGTLVSLVFGGPPRALINHQTGESFFLGIPIINPLPDRDTQADTSGGTGTP